MIFEDTVVKRLWLTECSGLAFFLAIKYFLVKVCAFFRHNVITLQYSMKITFFICTGEAKNLYDSLYSTHQPGDKVGW